VLTPTGILEGGELLIENGNISCAACDCSAQSAYSGATTLTCGQGLISPGLINAHDHLGFSQGAPLGHGTERYRHRHEWRKGKNGKTKITTPSNSDGDDGETWVEMRQAMGGSTSIFGSDGPSGFLRNLDKGHLLEGLSGDEARYQTFPLDDNGGTMSDSGCSAYDIDSSSSAEGYNAYVPHVAEGIIDEARNEFLCVSSEDNGGEDLVFDTASFIHGIGLKAQDIALMATESTGLIWAPRSNTDLYGMTADAPLYHSLGAQIAIGTDWSYSGSIHVQRELQCAAQWNDTYWNGYFSDDQLVAMATHQAAELLGFAAEIGSLSSGKVADVAIWDASTNQDYQAILSAGPKDVVLVLRGGEVLYGDATLVNSLASGDNCDSLDVCGSSKALCVQREIGQGFSAFESTLDSGDTYDLFFCGTPTSEPSCDPFRPEGGEVPIYSGSITSGDSDGDGIANGSDNCASHFNPVKPIDGSTQADYDGDGLGDICDPCPLNADTTSCSSIDPNDGDGDGVANSADNCSGIANTDQADSDSDGVGDVCDDCPNTTNVLGGCPTLIYDIKQGNVAVGESVALQNVVVTAATDMAFWVSVDPAGSDWTSADHAAIFAWNPGSDTQPSPGDKVNVGGSINDFHGQIQLSVSNVEVLASGVSVPDVITLTASAFAAADAYEGSLVKLSGVSVSDATPTAQDGEDVEGEFEVGDGIRVNDYIYLADPMPSEGTSYTSITGMLHYRWGQLQLTPRSAADYVQ
jgi:hypothetical protein